jgi:THO complex subunit 2
MAQQSHQYQQPLQNHGFPRDQQEQRGRGGRRGGRGGQRNGSLRSPMDSPNTIPIPPRQSNSNSNAMSPPPAPEQRPAESTGSSAQQLPMPVNNNSTQTQVSSLRPAPSFYLYEVLTDDLLKSWESGGRASLVELGQQACDDQDTFTLGTIFQEIIRSGLDGRISPQDAGTVVKGILERHPQQSESGEPLIAVPGASVFLNCISILTDSDFKHPSIAPMVLSTDISPQLMREELEIPLLEELGLIRNTFVRMGIRRQTNLLYRQSNYNLLREETEGYSKLITELFTTSNNEPPSAEVVEETFERVKAMIGTFDLDVGRVLDVTLDVFAAVLVKQYRFFVKYLRVSSWWPQQHIPLDASRSSLISSGLPSWALPDNSGLSAPSEKEKAEINEFRTKRDKDFWNRVREIGMKAFFELGGRKIKGSAIGTSSISDDGEDSNQVNEDRVWVETTGTLPPSGNKTAAQILGFKLRFYSSPARDPNDVLPVNLIYLAALLIKIGFISLRDLYPHLYPADSDMEKVKEEKLKEKLEREKKNRPGGAMNALMTAGALVDDTIPSGGRHREPEVNRGATTKVDSVPEKVAIPAIVEPKIEEKEELPEPADQKVQLLKSLLCIGAIPESLYIMGRFPWLVDAFPDLPEYIHRILHHSLSKVYEPLRPLRDRPELREQHKVVDSDQSGVLKGQLRQIDQPPRKVLRWAQLDKDDTNEGTDYRFYWDDWCDNVPLCQSVDDVFSLCSTLLNYSGVKIGQDPALLVKLARIGNHSLAEDLSEQNKLRWIDLSKRLLVPALSLTKSNAGVVNEVFELIKQFSTTTRYNIYAEWYSGSTSRLPDIKSAFDQVRAETKDVLKRISKTNVKPMARALAKVATASPGVVFQVAISQIESYDNLVEVVVECARYFTYLGYDVLTWSLMSALGTRGRNRVQADGMLTSKWLSALSLFAGKVFKRYSVMTPTPILQYVTEQLRQGNSTDLIVLEEITTSMAGIVSDTSFNETQVLGMAGGEVLQSQTMLQLLDRRHESTTTAKRLMKSLVEPRLAGQLLTSIAQERQTCVYKIPEEDAHLKLLGNLFDEIHRVLTQYLDLLRSRLAVKDFDALVPNVSQLIGEFGIDPPVAFWICRPSINAEMKHYDNVEAEIAAEKKKALKQPNQSIEQPEVSAVENGTDGVEPKPPSSQGEDNNMTVEGELPETDTVMKDSSQVDEDTRVPSSEAEEEVKLPWHQILQKLMEQISPKVPPPTWEVLSVSFYITFWQMSLNDLIVPVNNYQDEISRLQRKIASINADRSDISVAGTQKKEREKKAINDLQDQLQSERRDRMQHNIITRKRLQKEQDFWFADCWGKWEPLNIALLEHCFLPRILLSPLDSMYAFTMLKFLHGNGTKNFRTMGLLDQLFNGKRLTSLFFLCTSKEVENFGRFLNEVLKELSKWHVDKAVFEKEAYGIKRGLPGFCKKMTEDMTILSFWDYEDFRRVLQKWHMNLNTALKSCFASGEYMHIRNAIVVLKAVYLHFPVINWMGQAQVASVTELSKTESREDLKIAATSLLGNLKRRAKDWVLPQAFSLVSILSSCLQQEANIL